MFSFLYRKDQPSIAIRLSFFSTFFAFLLQNVKLQDTVFKLRGNILGFNGFADIKCSGAAACVTLLTNVLAGLLIGFVFIKAFDSADIQITIFDGDQ